MMESEFEKIPNLKAFLLESKSVICFTLDVEGNVLSCNQAYKRILGYTEKNIKEKLLNPQLQVLVNKFKDEVAFDGVITLKKEHLNSSFISKVYKCNDKLIFLCEYDGLEVETLFKEMSFNTLSINNMNRELIKKEIMLKNSISKQKETQAMLSQSEKMNALGQLVAGIVHEINNPMAYIMTNIEMIGQYFRSIKGFFEEYKKEKNLKIQNLEEKYNMDYILNDFSALQKETLAGGEKIKKIISDLRDYSRIDALEKSVSNISKCIMSSINIAKAEIKRNSINLKLNFLDTPDIECFPAQLNQVFLNLIMNSIQATGNKGNITIDLYEKAEFIIVEIEDDGAGILDENKCKIFEPFFTTKPKGIGVGLGLNLSYRIIKDMHKGKISFSSIAGKGTKFTISIPKGEK